MAENITVALSALDKIDRYMTLVAAILTPEQKAELAGLLVGLDASESVKGVTVKGGRARDAKGRYLPAGKAGKTTRKSTARVERAAGGGYVAVIGAGQAAPKAPKVTAPKAATVKHLCKATRQAFVAAAKAEGVDLSGMSTRDIAFSCLEAGGWAPTGFAIGDGYRALYAQLGR